MALTYGFYNSVAGDRKYDAVQVGRIFDGLITDGIYATYGDAMKVEASTNPNEVIIRSGRAWFMHTWSYNDSDYIFDLSPEEYQPEVLLDRIDALILDVNTENAARKNKFTIVKGTPASKDPARPTLTNTITHGQYALAYIYRKAGTTQLYKEDITNAIGTTETPFVANVVQGSFDVNAWIDQWDAEFHTWENATKTSFESWMLTQQGAYNTWYSTIQGQMETDLNSFEAWFQTIQGIIDEEAATHLQAEIDALAEQLPAGSNITITTEESTLYLRNVTVSDAVGHTKTVKFDSSGNAVVESFPYVGVLTVTSTDGNRTATDTISAPYYGKYRSSLAFWQATVIISDDRLSGLTVYVTDSNGLPVGNFTLNGEGYGSWKASAPDTYTFTVTYGGETMTISQVVSQETTYYVSFIPDGSSVTPTDDIQTWLQCAGIFDKTYTTLDEVLADSTTLLALISDHNAVDYMVRSKTWVKSDLVPAMTSNTTPSGVVSADSYWKAGYEEYLTFDGDSSKTAGWAANGTANRWLQYEFPTAKKIYSFDYKSGVYSGSVAIKNFKIQASNDGTNFTDLTELINNGTNQNLNTNVLTTKNNDVAYKYVRILIQDSNGSAYPGVAYLQYHSKTVIDDSTAMSYIGANDYCADTLLADSDWCDGICNSELFESVLNVKVPTMTSNTQPSGIASSKDVYGNAAAWKAFDKTSAYWCANSTHSWIAYEFTQPIKVKKVYMKNGGAALTTPYPVMQGYDSNTGDYVDLLTFDRLSGEMTYNLPLNETYYTKYRIKEISYGNWQNWIGIVEVQFYGRAVSSS